MPLLERLAGKPNGVPNRVQYTNLLVERQYILTCNLCAQLTALMSEDDSLKFHPSIYKLVGPDAELAMRAAEQQLQDTRRLVENLEQCFDPTKFLNPREVINTHNMLLDAIARASMLKHYLLNASIIRSVNAADFFSYALAGRALLELAATLRYYKHDLIMPLLDKRVSHQGLSLDEQLQLMEIEDKLLRGGRFDWPSFVLNKFDELQAAYAEAQKKPKGSPVTIKEPDADIQPTQVNVLTCIQRWARQEPMIGIVFDLFCDMVHPNVGSTLCIAIQGADGTTFAFPDEHDYRKSFGLALFHKSYPLLQALAARDIPEIAGSFLELKIPV